jgi:hypothetical protein
MTDEEVVEITVTESGSGNTAPELATIGAKSVEEGSELAFTVSATDTDNLTYTATGLPAGATLDPASGAFSWTPAAGASANSPYSVTFIVTDDGTPNMTDEETISITVTPPDENTAPVLAVIGSKTVTAGTPLTFTIIADDNEGDTLTFSATGLPAGASFDPATRKFSWTPAAGDVSATPYTVTFKVTDDGTPNMSDDEAVKITVRSVTDKLGDVDNNNSINIFDALLVAKYDADMVDAAELNLANANVDCSTEATIELRITIYDALKIARFDVGLVDELTCP